MTAAERSEAERLREFWNTRYAQFTLSESGWYGAGDALNDRLYACKRQALRRALAEAGVTPARSFTVLDVGCGQGHFAAFYGATYPLARYVGIDISDRAIAHLRASIPGGEFHAADVSDWRDPAGRRFDVVQALEVFHLMLDDDAVARAIGGLASRLAPGGALFVTAAWPSQTLQPSHYLRHRTRAFWENACAGASLRIAAARPIYYWLPAGGPSNKFVRYALTRLGAGALYAVDRAAIAVGLSRSADVDPDSATRLLTLEHA